MTNSLDLSTIFRTVTSALSENEDILNAADTTNHDHGTHMVQTFDLVQKAVTKQKSKPVSAQLAYASKVLAKQSQSGSGQIYAQGLASAAQKFKGKDLNEQTVGTLLNALMGSQQNAQSKSGVTQGGFLGSLLSGLTAGQSPVQTETNFASQDLFGSLLGGLAGTQTQPKPQSSANAEDLIGSLLGSSAGINTQPQSSNLQANSAGSGLFDSLLGSLTGTNSTEADQSSGGLLGNLLGGQQSKPNNQDTGLDFNDVLSAGLAFFSAKQSGHSNIEAISEALSSSSPLGNRPASTQSGALVINTILGLLGKKN